MEKARQACAVVACALNHPLTLTRGMAISEPQRLPVASRISAGLVVAVARELAGHSWACREQ